MTYSGPISTLVSCGSFPVIWLPSGLTPLPQSGAQGSVDCCGPYFATLNPQAFARSLGAQPIRGRVRIVPVPVRTSWSVNRSVSEPSGSSPGSGLSPGMFSKYQSLARFVVSVR